MNGILKLLVRRRRLAVVLGTVVVTGLFVSGLIAYFSGAAAAGSAGGAAATSVNPGSVPTSTGNAGRSVTLTWPAATLVTGQPVDGYIVTRYEGDAPFAPQLIQAGCSGTITALTCTESAVPFGNWKYTVTPVKGDNWRGLESLKSGSVTIGAASMTLDQSTLGLADFNGGLDPAALTGSLTGFASNEGITFKLDDASTGSTLSGSPASADGTGDAAVSIALPRPSDGPHSIYAVGDAGYPSQASASVLVDTTPPTSSATGNDGGWHANGVTVSLSADDGASGAGVKNITYDIDGGSLQTINGGGGDVAIDAPANHSNDGTHTITFFATDNAGNVESPSKAVTVRIDTTAPDFGSPTLTIGGSSGPAFSQYIAGTALFYNPQGSNSGSFTIDAPNAADPQSGIQKVNFPAPAGFGGGGDDSSAPYHASYSWSATSADSGSQIVTAYNNAGLASTATFTLTPDTSAPDGGAITANGSGSDSYNTTGTVGLSFTGFADSAGSGIATNAVTRAVGTLTNNVCGSISGATAVTITGGRDSASLTSGCYRYTLTGTDNVGNTATAQSATVRVDTTPPTTPTLAFTGLSPNAFYSSGPNTLYFRPAAGGAFTVTASSSDPDTSIKSGDAGYTFSSLAAGNFSGTQTGAGSSYTFGAAATAPASDPTVSSTNNAGGTSANASYHVKADVTAPSGGALTVNATAASGGGTSSTNSSGSFTIATRTDYAETQSATASGLASSTLVRDQATLAADGTGSCGSTWTSPTTIAGTPTQNAGAGITSGNCYRYTLTGTDNVGNSVSISTIVKVDTTAPAFGSPALTLSAVGSFAFYPGSGTTAYYNGTSGSSSSISVSAPNVADPESGLQKVNFTALSGFTGGGDDTSNPYSVTYTWSSSSDSGSKSVTATNGIGTTSTSNFTLVRDVSAPSGGALNVNGTAASGAGTTSVNTSGTFAIGTRTNYSEAQSGSASGLASSTLVRDQANFAAGSCDSFGSPVTVVGSPTQDAAAGITSGNCYRYTLTGTDNVGNAVSISSIVKVDTTAPAFGSPALTLIATGTFAFYPGSGTTVYYNGTTGTSSNFTVTAPNVGDGESGIQKVNFPALTGFSGGGDDSSSPYSATYTWSSSSDSGSKTVTATNGINNTSTSTFSLVRDVTAPSGGALTVNGTAAAGSTTSSFSTSGSFSIGRTDYAETQSASASGLTSSTLVRDQASLGSGGTCGSFGSATTIAGNPTQNAGAGISNGNCYRYTLTGTDNVGNNVNISTIVKVDTTAPTPVSVVAADDNTLGQISASNGSHQDTLTFTFSDATGIDPSSIVSGWDGTGPQSISVTFTDGGGANADSITVPGFGTVSLGGSGWLTATSTKSESLSRSSTNVFVLTIITSPTGNGTGNAASTFTWNTSGGTAKDLAGNSATGSVVTNTQRF